MKDSFIHGVEKYQNSLYLFYICCVGVLIRQPTMNNSLKRHLHNLLGVHPQEDCSINEHHFNLKTTLV